MPKYTLFVSHNCGTSYFPEKSSDNLADFVSRCEELDEQMLRWTLEDEEGDLVSMSGVHARILSFIGTVIKQIGE